VKLFGKRVDEPPERPRAQRPGAVPPDGPALVGGVELPSGQRDGTFWRTEHTRGLPALWGALAGRFAETGLWPVLLEKSQYPSQFEFDPGWEAEASADAEAMIAGTWDEDLDFDEELAEMLGPFPGIGRGGERVDGAAAEAIRGIQGIAGLALVPVTRPADVPSVMGWMGAVNSHDPPWLTAILRSWEERYDAILVSLGFDTMHVAVRRPPVKEDEIKTAAELYVFCTDVVDLDDDAIEELADGLSVTRAWMFWWD
jgi:hypothetical protein